METAPTPVAGDAAFPAITDDTFTAEVLEAEGTVVVDFWAPWCAPCRLMDQSIKAVAADRPDLRFVKLNADDEQRTVAQYGVMSMPTLIAFRHGRPVLQLIGARPPRRLAQDLAAI